MKNFMYKWKTQQLTRTQFEYLAKNAKEISYDVDSRGTITKKYLTEDKHLLIKTENGDDFTPYHYYIAL